MLGTHPQYHHRHVDHQDQDVVDLGPLPVSNLKAKKCSVAFDILPTAAATGSPPSPPALATKRASSKVSRRFTEPNLHAVSRLAHDSASHAAADHQAAMTRLAALQDRMHDHLHQHNDAHVREVVDKRHARVTELAARLDANHKAAQERAARKRQEKVEKLHRHNEEVARHKRKHECVECLRRQASIQYSSFVRHMSDDAATHARHMAAGATSHLHRHATHSGAMSQHGPAPSLAPAAALDLQNMMLAASASYSQLRRSYSYAPGMSMAPPPAQLVTRASATSGHDPLGTAASAASASEAGSPIQVMNPPMFQVRRSAMMMSTDSGRPSGSMSPTSLVAELLVPPEYCRRSSSAASIPGCAPLEMGSEE